MQGAATMTDPMAAANAMAVERLCAAEPVLVDVRPAIEVVPGFTPATIEMQSVMNVNDSGVISRPIGRARRMCKRIAVNDSGWGARDLLCFVGFERQGHFPADGVDVHLHQPAGDIG